MTPAIWPPTRWGRTPHRYDWLPFGPQALDHAAVDGTTIVSHGRVGWWFGTPRRPNGEMLRFTIDDITAR